jgi:hypothetical protein
MGKSMARKEVHTIGTAARLLDQVTLGNYSHEGHSPLCRCLSGGRDRVAVVLVLCQMQALGCSMMPDKELEVAHCLG